MIPDRRETIDSESSTNVPSSPPAGDSCRCNCAHAVSSAFSTFRAVDARGRGVDACLRRRRLVPGGRVRRIGARRQMTRNYLVKDLQPTEEPLTTASSRLEAIPASKEILTQTIPASAESRDSCNEQLPLDPRQWSRQDVHFWLRQMSIDYDDVIATPDYVITDRFPMNGKGLCLMASKPEMFETRVPRGGLLLFHDFRSRLLRAVTSSIDDRRNIAAQTEA